MTRIALCLSGGGFRATLFHLGVIRQLCETGELANVRVVTGVSGGGILAAHLALNWEIYLQGGDELEAMIQEVITFAQRDVRGRLIRRWLLSPFLFPMLGPKVFRRISLLEAEYSRLYRGSDLAILGPTYEHPERPCFYILATSMTSGNVCAFSSLGLELGPKVYKRQGLPLALAVASSSAFPPLFPPVVLTRDILDATALEFPQNFECLSDGGIYDNLGIRWLLRRQSRDFDRAILCDASAPIGWNVDSRFGSLLTRIIRTMDILMRRVVDFEGIPNPEHDDLQLVRTDLVSIKLEGSGAQAHPEEIRTRIPLIRTDLNAFADDEVDLLLKHGYAVADQVLGRADSSLNVERPFLTRSERGRLNQLLALLKRSRRNPFGLWNKKDWASYALWGLLISPIFIGWIAAMNASATISGLRESVEQQKAAIRELEDRVSNLDQSSSSPKPHLVPRISIHLGEHAHFVPSIPGALTVRPSRSDLDCVRSRKCEIAELDDRKWGVLFVADRPGTYTLIIENSSASQVLVQVAPHLQGQELGQVQEVLKLGPRQSVEYSVMVR